MRCLVVSTESVLENKPDFTLLSDTELISYFVSSQHRALDVMSQSSGIIAKSVRMAYQRLVGGEGRLVYFGAGSAGAQACVDVMELPGTFGWPSSRVRYLMAGGIESMIQNVGIAEDDESEAISWIKQLDLTPSDVVVFVSASGTTPFTLAGMQEAKKYGALCLVVTNNPDTPLGALSDVDICLLTGPEAIAGSTRLAAGSAQKIALNCFSSALMVRLGYVYQGHMVKMEVTNKKLRRRAISILMSITSVTTEQAECALERVHFDVCSAMLLLQGMEPEQADALMEKYQGNLQLALESLESE